jgi:hypothetical protein
MIRVNKGKERVSLSTVRKALGISREAMSESLNLSLSEVDLIEAHKVNSLDLLVRYAEACGAKLEIAFIFDETRQCFVDAGCQMTQGEPCPMLHCSGAGRGAGEEGI